MQLHFENEYSLSRLSICMTAILFALPFSCNILCGGECRHYNMFPKFTAVCDFAKFI